MTEPDVNVAGASKVDRCAREHELKTDPDVFDAVAAGAKNFEIRKDDRGFAVGDLLRLRKTANTGRGMLAGAPLIYLGEPLTRRVTYVMRGPVYGLADGWVIMGIEPVALGAASPSAHVAPETGQPASQADPQRLIDRAWQAAQAAQPAAPAELDELMAAIDTFGKRPDNLNRRAIESILRSALSEAAQAGAVQPAADALTLAQWADDLEYLHANSETHEEMPSMKRLRSLIEYLRGTAPKAAEPPAGLSSEDTTP